MCELCNTRRPLALTQPQIVAESSVVNFKRRKLFGLAAAGIFATAPTLAFAAGPPKPENKLSPDQALERLMQGNARYVSGKSVVGDFADTRSRLAGGQNPYACILSCADSRIGPEYCFDEGRGDLFVTRVAGNFVTPDILASLEYGTAVLGAPLIMVLGHTSCGAIGAAVDAYTKHQQYPGHIQLLTTALSDAVKAAQAQSSPSDLVRVTTEQNVIQNVRRLRSAAPVLASRASSKELMVVGGIYDLGTGEVRLIDA